MGFQTTVNRGPTVGIPGTPYTFGPEVITVKIAAGPVTVGRFVFTGPVVEDETGSTVTNSGSGQPLGLAIVTKTEASLDVALFEASMVVAVGNPVTIAERGGFYVVSATDAARGDAVYASLTDGTVATAAAGQTMADYVETAWTVAAPALAGEPLSINTWR